MGLNRTKLQQVAARAHYYTCKRVGVSFQFRNRHASAVTLWGLFSVDSITSVENGGSDSEIKTATIQVALQPNFVASTTDVEPVTLGDDFVYLGKSYKASSIEKDDLGALYTIKAKETKRISTGIS